MREETMHKWVRSGLLENLEDNDQQKMAVLLENQYQWCSGMLESDRVSAPLKRLSNQLALVLVRQVFEPLLDDFEVMATPNAISNTGQPISAKGRMLNVSLPYLYENLWPLDMNIAKYLEEVSPLLTDGMKPIIYGYPDRTVYLYLPFFFIEAELILPSGERAMRFSAMTRYGLE